MAPGMRTPHLTRFRILFLSLLFVLVAAPVGTVHGQDAEPGAQVVPDSSAAEESTILSTVDGVTDQLDALSAQVVPDSGIAELAARLPDFRLEVDSLEQRFDELPNVRLSLRDLDLVDRTYTRLAATASE